MVIVMPLIIPLFSPFTMPPAQSSETPNDKLDYFQSGGWDNPTFPRGQTAPDRDEFKRREALTVPWNEGPYAGESAAWTKRWRRQASWSTTPTLFRLRHTRRSNPTTARRSFGRPPVRSGCAVPFRCR
jgi:hypothetical protein